MTLEINYTFTLAHDVRGAWKRTKRHILMPWLIDVRIFLRTTDPEIIVHELVESYIAQLIDQFKYTNYEKACRIAHAITIISLPMLKG